MKKHRLILILVLFLGLFSALPWLLRTAPGRTAVFSFLGARFAGEMSAESCSLGWFSGLSCRNFHYQGRVWPLELTSRKLETNRGLFALILAPRHLGVFSLQAPEVKIRRAGKEGEAGAQTPPPDNTREMIHFWNKSSLQIQVQNGSLFFAQAGQQTQLLAHANARATLENGSLHYTGQASAGTGVERNLHGEGFVNVPPEHTKNSGLLGKTTLILDSGPTAVLPPLPWAPKALASLDGTVSGTCRILTNSLSGDLELEGSLSLRKLLFPPLLKGEERLALESAGLLFHAARQSGGTWQIKQLQLDSLPASLTLTGQMRAGKNELRAQARLSLPWLSEALRQKLALYEDARLREGNMQCNLQGSGPIEALPLQLDCAVSSLAASRGNTPFTWQEPFSLKAKALMERGQLSWRSVLGEGAFYVFQGQRENADPGASMKQQPPEAAETAEMTKAAEKAESSENKKGQAPARKDEALAGTENPAPSDLPAPGQKSFLFTAQADMGAISQEAGKILRLPLQARGAAKLSCKVQEKKQGAWHQTLHVEVKDFSLKKGQTELLPPHLFSLDASGLAAADKALTGAVHVSWWPGKLNLDLTQAKMAGKEREGAFKLEASVLLARAQALARYFLPSDAALNMSGELKLGLAGEFKADACQLSKARALFTNPAYQFSRGKERYAFQAAEILLAAGEAAKAPRPEAQAEMEKKPQKKAAKKIPPPDLGPLLLAFQQQGSPQTPDAGVAFFDFAEKSLRLNPMLFLSDGLQLTGDVALARWRQQQARYALNLQGEVDGALLDALLRLTKRMPNGLSLRGPSQLALQAHYPGAPFPEVQVAARLGWAGFGESGRPLFQKENLNLYARFKAQNSADLSSWDIPEISAQGLDFWAQGKGFLWHENKDSGGMLALQGQYQMQGEPKPFQISVPYH